MERFILSLILSSLTMTTVSIIYMLISRLLKNKQSAKWRYYGWILIFAGFVTPYKISVGKAAVNVNLYYSTVTVGKNSYVSVGFGEMLKNGFFDIVFLIWITGVIFFLGKSFLKQRAFKKSVSRLGSSASENIKEITNSIADELFIWNKIEVLTVSGVVSPLVTGFFNATIILPDTHYSEKELRLIIKHELIHFKGRDIFISAFMLFAKAVNWFNPFMNLFLQKAQQECEMLCDERVMAGEDLETRKLYCSSILNSLSSKDSQRQKSLKPALSSNFNISAKGIKQRLKMILSFDKKYKLRIVVLLTAAIILLTGTAAAFSDNMTYTDYGEAFATTSFETVVSDEIYAEAVASVVYNANP